MKDTKTDLHQNSKAENNNVWDQIALNGFDGKLDVREKND